MIWLSTSLFCNKKNWHYVLSNGIAPFVANCVALKSYAVEFSYLSGENIRLMLLTEDKAAAALAKYADEHFKAYFDKANLSVVKPDLPVEGIFMQFPSNSIQYGLYPPQSITGDDLKNYAISVELSKVITSTLKDEIDDETVITFAFYLQVALIKAIRQVTGNLEVLSSGLSEAPQADKYQPDGSVLANSALMKEIANDIWYTEEFYDELGWINSWVSCCKTLLTKNASSGIDNDTLSFYHTLVATIHRHLGINMHGRRMLNYFIGESLDSYVLLNTNKPDNTH